MRARTFAVSGALLVSAQFLNAAPGDHIRLGEGGLVSPSLEILIDLETGPATRRDMPIGTLTSGEQPKWQETKSQLSADDLRILKETARRSLADGLKSKACEERDKAAKESGLPPPQQFSVDSILILEAQIDGRSGHNPERFCESAAFNKLWEAAERAAVLRHVAPNERHGHRDAADHGLDR